MPSLQQQAVRLLAFNQSVGDNLRESFHAQRQHLQDDDPAETISDDARQPVRFAVDESAGIRSRTAHDETAVFARRFDAGRNERVRNLFLTMGQQANGDQGLAVVEARSHIAPAEIDDRHQRAILRLALNAFDLIAVDPRMPLKQLLLSAVDDVNDRKFFLIHFCIPQFYG